ncbi:hypothetical protein Pint_19567 [Pistacia integerrima]|uniref:Uncharacterized protein n=1 Tax=Pistacia integerrima TaxID=434235 RepID=A0ACC0XDW6_9ROSI|nr:hypothetical protein Pint_19567 [Pistacia integerrima]
MKMNCPRVTAPRSVPVPGTGTGTGTGTDSLNLGNGTPLVELITSIQMKRNFPVVMAWGRWATSKAIQWGQMFTVSELGVDDVVWSLVTAVESVALVSMLCFFFLFCGCTV